MPAIGIDTSIWVTSAQSVGLVAATVGATVLGSVLVTRIAKNLNQPELEAYNQQGTAQRRRVRPLSAAVPKPEATEKVTAAPQEQPEEQKQPQ